MEFINKVYIRKKSRTRKQIFSLVGSILCILILVSSFMLAGDIKINIAIAGMLAFLLSNSISGTGKGKYISVVSRLDLVNDVLRLVYFSIDREDGIGKRNEVIEFSKENISNIYYSYELDGIKIVGNGKREVEWTKTNGKDKKRRIDVINEVYIYFENLEKNDILQKIENELEKKIEYVK